MKFQYSNQQYQKMEQLIGILLLTATIVLANENQTVSYNQLKEPQPTQNTNHKHTPQRDDNPVRADEVFLQDRWPSMSGPAPITNLLGKTNSIQQESQPSVEVPYHVPHNGAPAPVTEVLDHYGMPYQPLYNYPYIKDHTTANRLEDEHEKYYSGRDVALGFIAYIAVLSILQGGLFTLVKDYPTIFSSARKKREAMVPVQTIPTTSTTHLEQSWLLGEEEQIRCIQHSLCAVNKQLVLELGITGKILGQYISTWTAKSVHSSWMRLVADAGQAGMQGDSCDVLYRGCHNKNTSN